MRPFVLLSIRDEAAAADDEHTAFARYLGVERGDLLRHPLGHAPLDLALDDLSGVLLGGGAFTVSDDAGSKSARQVTVEAELSLLLDEVVARDFPFLGACYGIGTLGTHRGGVVDKQFPEGVGPVWVDQTDDGADDPLFGGVPHRFAAYGGHKESLSRAPDDAVVLAGSPTCPVQAFRVGRNVYATQFHPELDLEGLMLRIDTYATHGYFDPAAAGQLKAAAGEAVVSHPMRLLANFAALHAR